MLAVAQVVFVHPNALPGPLAEGISPGIVDFLCDSWRTVASMVRPTPDLFSPELASLVTCMWAAP